VLFRSTFDGDTLTNKNKAININSFVNSIYPSSSTPDDIFNIANHNDIISLIQNTDITDYDITTNTYGYSYILLLITSNTYLVGEKNIAITNKYGSVINNHAKLQYECAWLSTNPSKTATRASVSHETIIDESFLVANTNDTRNKICLGSNSPIGNTTNSQLLNSNGVAQLFYVKEDTFLTSVDLYFDKKPASATSDVIVEIRDTMNGFPYQNVVPYSTTRLKHNQVQTTTTNIRVTNVPFSNTIYLKGGQHYALVIYVTDNNKDYVLHSSTIGEMDTVTGMIIGDTNFVGNMAIGNHVKGWNIITNKRITFSLFATTFEDNGSISFINAPQDWLTLSNTNFFEGEPLDKQVFTSYEYVGIVTNKSNFNITLEHSTGILSVGDLVRGRFSNNTANITAITNRIASSININSSQITLSGTSITYDLTYRDGMDIITTTTITNNTDTLIPNGLKVNSQSDASSITDLYKINMLMATTNPRISPILDISKFGCKLSKWHANACGSCTLNIPITESMDLTTSGNYTRYVTKFVELSPGMDAEDLIVMLDVDNTISTFNEEVYCKVINATDTTGLDDKYSDHDWILMDKAVTNPKTGYDEKTYTIPTLNKIGGIVNYTRGLNTYSGFKKFAVKIVFASVNHTKLPYISNLRATAIQV